MKTFQFAVACSTFSIYYYKHLILNDCGFHKAMKIIVLKTFHLYGNYVKYMYVLIIIFLVHLHHLAC